MSLSVVLMQLPCTERLAWEAAFHLQCCLQEEAARPHPGEEGIHLFSQKQALVWGEKDLKVHLFHRQWYLPLDQVLQSLIQPGLAHFQGWVVHNFPEQPVPEPHHPHSTEFLADIWSKFALLQLKAIPLCPITPCICSGSGRCCEVFQEPLSRLNSPSSQPVHRRCAPACDHHWGLTLNFSQQFNIFLVLWVPELYSRCGVFCFKAKSLWIFLLILKLGKYNGWAEFYLFLKARVRNFVVLCTKTCKSHLVRGTSKEVRCGHFWLSSGMSDSAVALLQAESLSCSCGFWTLCIQWAVMV